MPTAASSLFKPFTVAESCLTTLPCIFTAKSRYSFLPLPSKSSLKSATFSTSALSFIPSCKVVSFWRFHVKTFVAQTSDWAQQQEEEGVEFAAGLEEDGGEEGEEFLAEPPEVAKLFVGNLPYDFDSEALAEVNKAAPKGARPERQERSFAPSFKVYVGNLSWQVDDARLGEVFSEHGKVVDARVVYDRETQRSQGFGFVTFSSEIEVNDAIAALDGQTLDGRAIRVNVAENRPRRAF